jgi:long-chain acyl-CoA synthetase
MKLKEDLAVLKPTVFASVPRLYNRFYDLMQQKINEVTGIKRKLINRAVAVKLSNLEKTADVTHMLYDSLVFNKFKEILGGRVRVMVSGSAPISKEVLSFLKIAFCAPILEAYGQTESAAPATATWIKDPTVGHVGAPFPSTSVKLVDVPEMNYTSKDKDEAGNSQPRGEICYKGYSSFKGYFRQLEQTRDTID